MLDVLQANQDELPVMAVEDFMSSVEIAEVRVVVPRPRSIDQPFEIIHKIRGALGDMLRLGASDGAMAGGPCNFADPCAYHVMWNSLGEVKPGYPIPHPFVILADPVGRQLHIALRLFGQATVYIREVGDALIRALRHGLTGVEPKGKTWRCQEISDRRFALQVGLPVHPITHQVRLETVTPLLMRNGNEAHIDCSTLLRVMMHRFDGFMRLHGCRLGSDAAKELIARSYKVEGALGEIEVYRNSRHSRPQSRNIPITGALTTISLQGELLPFAPIISLSEMVFAGSKTALGQGRLRVLHSF